MTFNRNKEDKLLIVNEENQSSKFERATLKLCVNIFY